METWLTDNTEIIPTGICLYQRDRGIVGGGVVAMVSNNLSAVLLLNQSSAEMITLEIHSSPSFFVLYICFPYLS